MAGNWLDRTVSFVSPAAGARRAKSRALEQQYTSYARKYEGASRSRRTAGWNPSNKSANSEISTDRNILRARGRDLVRNNAFASKAVQVISSNVTGDGIVPTITCRATAKQKKLNEVFNAWAGTRSIDADGRLDLFGMQALVMRAVAGEGDIFIRRRRRRLEDNLPIPIQLQVLEADFLDYSKDAVFKDGNRIISGIEFDALGRRIAYHMFKEHPGSDTALTRDTVRIPAEDIIHVYRMDRAGQMLGVSWLSPIMIRLRDFDEYEDAQLMKQKVSACMTAFVYDSDYEGDAVEPENDDNEIMGKMQPGAIHKLGPGKQVTIANPPSVADYDPFSKRSLHAIAAGIGITYESLTGDLHETNFSSGRMGWLEFQRNIDQWRWNMLIPTFCEGVWHWFVEELNLQSIKTDDVMCEWTAPARQMIDPSKEINANVKAIRSGQKSLSETLREQGMNPDKVFAEIAEEQKKFDQLGLVFDSDPRKTSLSGALQISQEGDLNDASEE